MSEAFEKPKRGNKDIVKEGKEASDRAFVESDAEIERAKSEIKRALRDPASKFLDRQLTVAVVLRTAKLSPTFLEKPNRAQTKLKLKKWVKGINARLVGGRLATSRKGEDFEALKERFIDMQSAYAAASLVYSERASDLAKAKADINALTATISELKMKLSVFDTAVG